MSEQTQEERVNQDEERLQQPTTLVEVSSVTIVGDGNDQKQSTGAVTQETTANSNEDSFTEVGPPPLKKVKLAESSRSGQAQDATASGSTATGLAVSSTSDPPPADTKVGVPAKSPAAALATTSFPNPPSENDTSASTTTKQAPAHSTTSSSVATASHSATSVPAKHSTVDTSTTAPAITTTTTQSSQLLPDYATVRQTVHDMLALLQTYGPLTEGQLEYNLPPVGQQHQNNNADDDTFSPQEWKISDVLELLVALGLVQKVNHKNISNNSSTNTTVSADPPTENGDNTTTTTTTHATANLPPPPVVSAAASVPAQQYCVCGGVPRVDVVLPSEVIADITSAHREAARSWQRSRVLQKALLNNWSTKTVLEQLLKEFPEIGNDPVYRAALRNCHVSIADGTSTKRSSSGSSKRAAASQSGGTGSMTKAKTTPKSTPATGGAPRGSAPGPSAASIAAVAAAKAVQAQKQLASQQQQQEATRSSNSPVATLPTPPVSTTATSETASVPTAVSAAPSTDVQPPPPEAGVASVGHGQPPAKANEESLTKPEMNTK